MTAFERIITKHVPAWAEKFRAKSDDYNSSEEFGGMEPHTILGIRGQFADIWRKVWKLKKALWDGETLAGEQPREIIQDLIAHLFLTLDLMEQQEQASLKAFEAAYPGVTLETEGRTQADVAPGVTVLPDGGAREGAQRLGISEADWERIKEWANDVHNTGKPEILEKHGYFLQTNQPEEFSQPCGGCTWTRTMEEGRVEYHIYKGSCIYRIRQRKVRP